MLFIEVITVYCQNHAEHINTLCGQNADIFGVKVGGMFSNYWAAKC